MAGFRKLMDVLKALPKSTKGSTFALVLAVSQSVRSTTSIMEPALVPINSKPRLLFDVGLTGSSFIALRHLVPGVLPESVLDTVSLHWQTPVPVTLCSRQSLQVVELPEPRALSVEPVQREVHGRPLFCTVIKALEQKAGRGELYVDVDNHEWIDLQSSFIEIDGKPVSLMSLRPMPGIENPNLPSLTLPSCLLDKKKPLRLDISGWQVREMPNGKNEGKQDGSLPPDQDATNDQGAQASSGKDVTASGSGGSSGGDEREDDGNDKLPGYNTSTEAYYSDNPEIYGLLLKALENDDLEEFKSILAKHGREHIVSLNVRKDDLFLWEIALRRRKPRILGFLLDYLNIKLNNNRLATETMRLAIVNSEVEMVRMLLDAGAEPHIDSVAYAIEYGGQNQMELVDLLLDAGAEPTTVLYGFRNCNIW